MAKGRYTIVLWPLAETELGALRSFDRRRIQDAINQQLQHDPFVATRNRKPLPGVVPVFEHEKPVWELRVGQYRVFYDAGTDTDKVHVRSVKRKLPGQTTQEITT